MQYDLELVADDGSVFPYADQSSADGYDYRISLELDGEGCELLIQPHSLHVSFDDSGDWLQFSQAPSALFGETEQLTTDQLWQCVAWVAEHWDEGQWLSATQVRQLLGMLTQG